MWPQDYTPVLGSVPLSAVVAGVPLYLLFYLLAVRGKPAHVAGPAGLLVALALAILVYGMPPVLALSAAAMGAAFALFPILWIVANALFLYRLTVDTGRFAGVRDSIVALSPDIRVQALVIVFCFGALIEGIAGFGTPVALSAAMLAGIGFDPRAAVVVSLLSNTAPVAFGNLGIPIVSLAGVIQPFLDVPRGAIQAALSTMVARQISLLSLVVPSLAIGVIAGWRGLRDVWPATVVAGVAFAVTQLFVASTLGPTLPNVASAIVALAAVVILLRFWQPAPSPSATASAGIVAPHSVPGHHHERVESSEIPELSVPELDEPLDQPIVEPPRRVSLREALVAWEPFLVLVAVIVVGTLPAIATALDSQTLRLPWPGLHNAVLRTPPVVPPDEVGTAAAQYSAIFVLDWLRSPGTLTLLAAGIVVLLTRTPIRVALRLYGDTIAALRLPALAVVSVLALAWVMNYSGMTVSLALLFTFTGPLFPFFAAVIGWIGVFLTGSDTAANNLFGGLQAVVAQQVGVSPVLTAATNSSGGVTAKMISPQNLAIGVGSVGLTGQEGSILRAMLPWSVGLLVAIGLLALAQAYVFPGTIPPLP